MSSSLGKQAICDQLLVKEIGSLTTPVETIHRASTDIYQNDLKFVENASGETRLIIRTDGHLAVSQDVEFYGGTNINTGTKRYSVGLNEAGDKFVIRDEAAGVDRLSIDSEGKITGLENASGVQVALNTTSGLSISTTVLDTFALAAGGDGVGYSNSLLTAGAIENWFEQLQNSLIMISPGQSGPGFRVASISTTLPSSTNVPSCLAVSNFVNTKLTPINLDITSLQSSKVDQSLIASSIVPSNLSSSNLVTEGGILNFLGNPVLTENGIPIIKSQQKLYAKSITETTDPNFNFIKSGVHDVTSGFDATKDNRIATMACTDGHITSKINSLVPTLISNSFVSPTFTGTVTLPGPSNVLLDFGVFTSTIPNYLLNVIDGHTFSDGVNMHNIYLENSSYLQFNSSTGLGVLNSAENAYVPVFCEDVFIGGDSVVPGTSIAGLIDEKVGVPYTGFFIPSGVTDINLGYLANVSSDIQQQFTTLTTSIINLDNTLTANITAVDNSVTSKTFNPLILGGTTLYNINYSGVDTLGVTSNTANPSSRVLQPVVCSELYTGGTPTAIGTSLTSRLNLKVNAADTTTTVTADESKLVTSGAVHSALAGKLNSREVVSTVTQSSQALITSGGVFTQFTTLTNLITALTARVVILEASITPTTTPGLSGIKYFGYYNDSFTFFNTASQYSGFPQNYTSIELGDEGSYYSYRFTGNFTPNATGNWSFRTASDDASHFVITDSNGTSTTVVDNGGTHGIQTVTGTYAATAGQVYSITIYFGEKDGGAGMTFSFAVPGSSSFSTDLTLFTGFFIFTE